MKYFILFFAKRILFFTIKETKLFFPVVFLSAKNKKKRLNLLFSYQSIERSVYYNQCKIKSVNKDKDMPNEYVYMHLCISTYI